MKITRTPSAAEICIHIQHKAEMLEWDVKSKSETLAIMQDNNHYLILVFSMYKMGLKSRYILMIDCCELVVCNKIK